MGPRNVYNIITICGNDLYYNFMESTTYERPCVLVNLNPFPVTAIQFVSLQSESLSHTRRYLKRRFSELNNILCEKTVGCNKFCYSKGSKSEISYAHFVVLEKGDQDILVFV